MKMAFESTEIVKSKMLLTSGASGRVNALIISTWQSLLMLIKVLLFALYLPFARAFNASRKISAKEEIQEVIASRYGNVSPWARLSSAIVARRVASTKTDLDVTIRRAIQMARIKEDKDSGSATKREFSLFGTPRGATLFTQSWIPICGEARGLVVVVHGLNEHGGRYNELAQKLNAANFKVYALDWIGHGGSDGLHGYVHSLEDAVFDLKAYVEKVKDLNPGLPCFCLGHSTGGAIILKATLDPRFEGKIKGVVLTSPAISVQPAHPIYTIIAPIASMLLPRYQCYAANKKGAIVSRDPEVLKAKYSDPLVYTGPIRVRTGYEILKITSYLQEHLKRLTIPFLVLHGNADIITDPKASLKLYTEASSTDKNIKLYDGLFHDLLYEPERESIYWDITEWLRDRV